MFYIVSYDIKDDRRRNRIAKIMESFGDRVQYSVFECNMEDAELARMQKRLEKNFDNKEDKIRIYRLCAACKLDITVLGEGKVSEDPDIIII